MSDGGLVKTQQFKSPKYVGDPLNAVKIFNEKEVDELIIFDIDATQQNRPPNFDTLKKIAIESRMPLCYGGGITHANEAERIISLGFEKISLGASALMRPNLIKEVAHAIGSQSVVVTLDVKKNKLFSGYTLYTCNGQKKNNVELLTFCKSATELGVGEIIINSIDRDGTMSGYDLTLAGSVRAATSLPLSFLGGAGSVNDMQWLIDKVGVVGAAAGSLFVFKGKYRAVLINYERPSRLCRHQS